MKENKKLTPKRIWAVVLGFTGMLLLSVVGTVLFAAVLPEKTADWICCILAGLLAIWGACNMCFGTGQNCRKPQDREQIRKLKAFRDGGEAARVQLQKQLDKMCLLSDLSAVFLGILAVLLSLMLYPHPGLAILPYGVFNGLIQRYWPEKEPEEQINWVSRKEYPELYALAEQAQKAVGGSRPIRILHEFGCTAAVSLYQGYACLVLGVPLLYTFSREEVYQILLHEFAHLQNDRQLRYDRRSQRLGTADLLFGIADCKEGEAYGYYRIFTSRNQEAAADRAILEKGDPQTAANAFAKLSCNDNYEKDFLNAAEYPCLFCHEEPPEHWISYVAENFRQAVEQNLSLAHELVFKEIPPRVGSHPIARERIRALGVENVSICFPQHQGAWARECAAAMDWADRELYQQMKESYRQEREVRYLKPLQEIADWRAAGEPLSYEKTRPVLEAMFSLRQYEEVIALSKAFADSGVPATERCHGVFFEGLSRLRLGDISGLDVLYEAMALNHNYVDDACNAIATYCAAMGLQEEMERYRNFTQENEEEFLDHESMFPLHPKDRLEPWYTQDPVFSENLAVIRAAAGEDLLSVYLVKKVVSRNTSFYIYLLELCQGLEEERREAIYNRVFMHLDKQETQYGLTFLEEESGTKWLKKRKEFMVFSASEEKP